MALSEDLGGALGADAERSTLEDLLAPGYSESVGLLVLLNLLQRDREKADASSPGQDWFNKPRIVDKFRLDSLLGTGAFGAVFRAFDTKLLRQVALKVAWPNVLMHPVASRRFNDEPATIAALRHPGIVEVFDSAEVGLISYIALELVEGPNLADWSVAQSNVPIRIAAQIVSDLAATIHFAHEQGVVHRDLKPTNILLRPCSRPGGPLTFEPVVTDFGLARGPRRAGLSSLTGTTDIIGTDFYMAPEQAAGLGDQVGPASDVFSLGVILYELATGRRPFDGQTSDEVRHEICNAEPTVIHRASGSSTRDLNAIIGKCLEKSPSRRYRTAHDLACDLQRLLDGKPIQARAIPAWRRAWKLARRHPLASSFVATICAAALIFGAFAGAWMRDRRAALDEITAAKASAAESEETERQHRYGEAIQHAAASSRQGNRAETLEFLGIAESLAHGQVRKGIEWDVVSAGTNDEYKTLSALSTVRDVRFAPSGDLMASASAEGLTTLWNVGNWTRNRLVVSGVLGPRVAEFSQDGSLLAIAGDNGVASVHRIDGSSVFKKKINEGRIFTATWLGDSERLAVGGDSAVLHVINVASGERNETAPLVPGASVPAHEAGNANEIIGLTYVADRNLIGVLKSPTEVVLIDAGTLEIVGGWTADLENAGAICHIPLGPGYFAIGSSARTIVVYEIDTGKRVAVIPLLSIPRCMRYSSVNGQVCAGFFDGSTQTWPIASILAGNATAGHRFKAHSGHTLSVDLSPNGEWFASGGRDCTIRIWHQPTRGGSTFTPLDAPPQVIKFSPCGRWLLVCERVAAQKAILRLFEVQAGRMAWSADVLGPSNSIDWVGNDNFVFDSLGDELALVETDGSVSSRDTRTGQVVKTHVGSDQHVENLWFSSDGTNIVLQPFPRPERPNLFAIDRKHGTRTDLTVLDETFLGTFRTNEGELWISTNASHQCLLRRSRLGSVLPQRLTMPERPAGVVVSEDGRYLAAWGASPTTYLWELHGSSRAEKLVGHEERITALLFSPDGRTLLSRGSNNTLHFWDTKTHVELLSLGSEDEQILSMSLHPSGGMLVLGVKREEHFGLRVYRFKHAQNELPSTFEIEVPAPTEQVDLE